MAKIYKRTDRIPVKIDDITVLLAPLSLDEKTEIQNMHAQGHIKKDYSLLQKAISKSIKYSLKDIRGVEDQDGKPYRLSFDESKHVSDECLDDIYNLEMHSKLVMVVSTLVKTIPKVFTDNNGNPIEGVEILTVNKEESPADPN